MDITWYGLSCFRLVERGSVTVVSDPYDPTTGFGELNLKGDVVTISHDAPGHNWVDAVKKVNYVLNRPGEYEIGGLFVTGVATYDPDGGDEMRHNIIWVYQYDGLTVAHFGDLQHVPTQAQIEALGPINVLMIPVGAGVALNGSQAVEVVRLIEPAIVIPMHYAVPGSNLTLEPLNNFLAEMGVSSVEELDTLRVNPSNLGEETQVVVLKMQS
jgi:L-ascorbate metabolism protein UlaG (beta-lactamase superfamily)